MKRHTDKERLDWMKTHGFELKSRYSMMHGPVFTIEFGPIKDKQFKFGGSLRKTIDAAMRAESKE